MKPLGSGDYRYGHATHGHLPHKGPTPTLISFAIAPLKADEVLSPEFKEANHPVYLFAPTDDNGDSMKAAWDEWATKGGDQETAEYNEAYHAAQK